MWQNETIFSGGDLSQGKPWAEFMQKEYPIVDEESANAAVQDRKEHIQSCIERLTAELVMIDELAMILPCGEDCDQCDATSNECAYLYMKTH